MANRPETTIAGRPLRIPGYTIERELGRGGMAVVFAAYDEQHARLVALKVLNPELGVALGHERFTREIRLAAGLQHPNILPLFDSGHDGDLFWYTMPLVEGSSLQQRIATDRRLSIDDAVRITREVAEALAHAHARGIVHRDIKPGNILLSGGHALVADFGIARAIATPTNDQLTQTGISVGTPAYMSPEQAAGDPALDGRSDIYSLGCVLYEMLAGAAPFAASSRAAVLSRQLTETVPRVRAVRSEVPVWLERVLEKALAKSPDDRWAHAADFADALATHVAPARARPRGPVLLAAAAVALVLIGGAWSARHYLWSGAALDANLIAVAPFDVLGARNPEYREGLVDLVSASMDGAGPLRAVPVTRVMKIWSGRGDATTATALGRGTGARLVIYGNVVPTGGDSVRVTVSLIDAQSGGTQAFEIRDDAQRLDRVSDSLTVRVLRELGRTRPIGAVRAQALGSTSLPAMKAFLRGEQFLRSALRDSATAYYTRATDIDPHMALAWRRMADLQDYSPNTSDSLLALYRDRAARFNHGLPARESLLIVADSLLEALGAQDRDLLWAEHHRRLYATLAVTTTRYPADPEAWLQLGHARALYPPSDGTLEQTLDAFVRASALDSTEESMRPLSELAFRLDRPDDARRYLAARRAHVPAYATSEVAQLVERLLDPDLRSRERDRLIAAASTNALTGAFGHLADWLDSAETAVLLARAKLERAHSDGSDIDYFIALFMRGHVARAIQEVASGQLQNLWPFVINEFAMLGAIPAESASAFVNGRYDAARRGKQIGGGYQGFEAASSVLEFFASRGDTAAILRYRRALDSATRTTSRSIMAKRSGPLSRIDREMATAFLTLARGDSARALELFLPLAHTDCSGCSYGRLRTNRLTAAKLLSRRGRDRAALLLLEGSINMGLPNWLEVRRAIELGRVAERLGERERARDAYRYVWHAWMHADPPLLRFATEASDGLVRVGGSRN